MAVEPAQSSKGRVVKTHADADAEHNPGDRQIRDAVRSGEDQQSCGDDQVRRGQQTAPTMSVDQPPD
jgi:hypothetical protein